MIKHIPSAVSLLVEADYYLIKLYVYNDEPLFGNIEDGYPQLNDVGQIAADEWLRSAGTYSSLNIDTWVLLPNRLEGLVSIRESCFSGSYGGQGGKPRLLSSFIASYKAAAAKRINLLRNQPGSVVWQRSYQERFIPDDGVLRRVRQMLQQQPGQ
jgi:putative transposase